MTLWCLVYGIKLLWALLSVQIENLCCVDRYRWWVEGSVGRSIDIFSLVVEVERVISRKGGNGEDANCRLYESLQRRFTTSSTSNTHRTSNVITLLLRRTWSKNRLKGEKRVLSSLEELKRLSAFDDGKRRRTFNERGKGRKEDHPNIPYTRRDIGEYSWVRTERG